MRHEQIALQFDATSNPHPPRTKNILKNLKIYHPPNAVDNS